MKPIEGGPKIWQKWYTNVKDLIIQWIENNYNEFLNYFGDDENDNIKKEVLAKHEVEYIKKKIVGVLIIP